MATAPRRTVLSLACAMVATTATTVAADTLTIGDETWHRSEWRGSTFTMSAQSQASLAVDREGNVTLVWSSRRQQEGRYGVYAQRFDANGVALGEETCINLWTTNHQKSPAVAIGAGDTPWVVWESFRQDGQAGSVMARRLGAAGSAGSEIAVNETWRGHQSDPIIAVAPTGEAMVVWTSQDAADQPARIRARRLDAAGNAIGAEFGICVDEGFRGRTPAVACAADGSFVLAYAVAGEQPWETAVRVQRFDVDGARLGLPIEVSPGVGLSQIEPAVEATPDGYVVAWLDAESDGSDYGVLARRLDAGGVPAGPAFVVNTTHRGPQNAVAIAARADGRFAILYNGEDADGKGILGQMFETDGSRLGGEFRVNARTEGDQAMREVIAASRVAFSPNGSLLCAWSGDAGLGDGSSANITMLSPRPIELADAVPGVTDSMRPAAMTAADGALALADAPTPHTPPTFDPGMVEPYEQEIRMGARGRIGFTGVTHSGWTPPDPHLAVGPEHVVVMTNGEIAIFEKDGTRIFVDEIENSFGFWGSLGADNFVFDPEVLYDPHSQRFMAMACERSDNNRSNFLFAVSHDATPNGTGNDWHKYRLDVTALAGSDIDSPNMGVDKDVVYLSSDHFGPSNYLIVMLPKSDVLVGNAPTMTSILVVGSHSYGMPVNFDASAAAQYMIQGFEFNTYTEVRLHAITDPLGSPTRVTFDLTVPSYSHPEDPPQMGTSSRPEVFEARFWSCVYRNGALWAVHHVNGSRVRARWYEINMNDWPSADGGTPTLEQSGEIDLGSTIRTFFPSIWVGDNGTAAITYARSSPTEFISMETTYRLAGDPPGTMQPGVQRAVNTSGYSAGRWGDYSAVGSDPVDGSFWAHHEYAIGGSWRTWIQNFGPDCGTADANCDGFVDFEDLLLVLSGWGPCKGCPGDVNGDGEANLDDILLILEFWS